MGKRPLSCLRDERENWRRAHVESREQRGRGEILLWGLSTTKHLLTGSPSSTATTYNPAMDSSSPPCQSCSYPLCLTQVTMYESPSTASYVAQIAIYLCSCAQSLKNKGGELWIWILSACLQNLFLEKWGIPTKDNIRSASLFFSDRHLTRWSELRGSSEVHTYRTKKIVYERKKFC